MSIYIDTYFVLNFAVDYLLLLATARLRALSVRRLRLLFGALLGAAYAIACLLLPPGLMGSPWLILSAAALMLLIAFGGTEGFLRTALTYTGVSAAFGGIAMALERLTGGLRMDLGLLLLTFFVSWLVLKLTFFRKAAALPKRVQVDIFLGGAHVRLLALGDSGNLLSDPVSGDRVLVAEAAALAPLFPGETGALLRRGAKATELLEAPGAKGHFRLIPYGSVEGTGFLAAFRPKKLLLGGKEKKDLLVGIAPGKVSDTDAFQALLGGTF